MTKQALILLFFIAMSLALTIPFSTHQAAHDGNCPPTNTQIKLTTKEGKSDYATCAGSYALINTDPLMYENVEGKRVIGFNSCSQYYVIFASNYKDVFRQNVALGGFHFSTSAGANITSSQWASYDITSA